MMDDKLPELHDLPSWSPQAPEIGLEPGALEGKPQDEPPAMEPDRGDAAEPDARA